MGEMDITHSEASDLTNVVTDFEVDPATLEGAEDQKETTWMNTEWSTYYGYYKSIPELSAVIDAKAHWTVGKGFKADEMTTLFLDTIKGLGYDTFNTIIENMDRVHEIGGDAYAEIIKNKDGNLINLKPLDPLVMRHVANRKGRIIKFEMVGKTGKEKGKVIQKFNRNQIFYIPRNRTGDEIHGNTMIEKLTTIILARNEAMADIKQVYHRFVKPRWIIKLDTDVPAEIAAEKAKWDLANEQGENMYIPMGSAEAEQMSISPNSTLNPLTYIENLTNYFYEAANCPKIIVGGAGGFTEAAVKIAYLAFQQTIEARQLFWEEQILAQLNLVVEFEFPASLENELLSDKKKDGAQNIDASETTAGRGQ